MGNLRRARTYQADGTRDYLRAIFLMADGNGVLVVFSARESRVHGEGAQTGLIPGNREEHVICDLPKLSSVCFKIEHSSFAKPATTPFIKNEKRQVILEGNTVGKPDDAKGITSGLEEGDRRRAAMQ